MFEVQFNVIAPSFVFPMTVTTPVVFGANSIAPPALIDSILFALIVKLSTVNVVKSPTLVMADCAAPVTVAAVPDALPVTLPVKLPEIVPPAVIAPVATAPVVVIVDDPILILPNPDVIEPEFNAPTVTNDPLPAVGDLPDKSVVKFKILDCAMAADALILASAILVIELPVASWSIVLFVNVVVLDAVTVE